MATKTISIDLVAYNKLAAARLSPKDSFGDIHHPAGAAMLGRFDILPMDEFTAHHYAITARLLRGQNQLIGTNDLWIAAAALAYAIPLVTNQSAHFSRIPGLSVVAY